MSAPQRPTDSGKPGNQNPASTSHSRTPPYPTGRGAPTYQGMPNMPNTTGESTQQHSLMGQTHVHQFDNPHHTTVSPVDQSHPTGNASHNRTSGLYQQQGYVTNNLNIDPALLPQPQNGYQQPPAQTFNMSPGSHVSFSGNPFQHMQAAHQSYVQGNNPPTSNAEVQAFQDLTHHFSDEDDLSSEKPVFKPTVFDNRNLSHVFDNLGGTYNPQPVSHGAMTANSNNAYISNVTGNGNKNLLAYSQHDTLSPDDMSYNHGQSVAGASSALDGTELGAYTAASISSVKKRRRSASNGDNASDIDNNDEETLPQAQRSTSQRKSTKRSRAGTPVPPPSTRPSTHASTQSISSAMAVQTQNALPVLAAAGSPAATSSQVNLTNMSLLQAQQVCIRRIPLTLKSPDDILEVKADKANWILKIMAIFDAPYPRAPVLKAFPKQNLAGFGRWQDFYHSKVMAELDEHEDLSEACAIVIYNLVVEAHEEGGLIRPSGTSCKAELEYTCKTRLETIIKALTASTIMRYDLVMNARLEELVVGPWKQLRRKEDNKHDNDYKATAKPASESAKTVKKRGSRDKVFAAAAAVDDDEDTGAVEDNEAKVEEEEVDEDEELEVDDAGSE